MVYFMQSIDGGPIKIGTTENLDLRRIHLESHFGCRLAVLATMPGGRPEEKAFHARFSHLRFGRTEQFRPAPDLMAFIGRPLLVGANPDAVEPMDGRNPARVRSAVVNVRSRPEWKEWLERFSGHINKDVSDVIDEALLRFARDAKFEMPPKR